MEEIKPSKAPLVIFLIFAVVATIGVGLLYFERLSDAAGTTGDNAAEQGRTVTINRAPNGNFLVDGFIGDQKVRFLVNFQTDNVLLSPQDAKRLGYDFRWDEYTQVYFVDTGQVIAKDVTFDRVTIGTISLGNVEGAVSYSNMGYSLLGRSFLTRIAGFRREGDQIILTQ